MELITVREIFAQPDAYMDKEVTVGGWIRSIRDSKTFGFIVLSDGTSFEPIQVVYHDTMENFAEISKCNVGTALIVKGTLVATPQAKQPFEIQAVTTRLIVQQHRHDKHEDFLSLRLHGRHNNARTTWVGKSDKGVL